MVLTRRRTWWLVLPRSRLRLRTRLLPLRHVWMLSCPAPLLRKRRPLHWPHEEREHDPDCEQATPHLHSSVVLFLILILP
jgi:hypothetical protein